jgi:hypothetical protein
MPELATAFVAKDSRPPTTSDESIVAIANFDDTSLIRDEQDA